MPGGGIGLGTDWFNQRPSAPTTQQPNAPTKSYGSPNTFTTAANQQAKDYDDIMKQYKDLAANAGQNPIQAGRVSSSTIAPQTTQYRPSSDVTGSLRNLQELSQTGGYSDQGIRDLRERGVSPVRSIYASANRNLNRARGLSGGYSPNFGALTAKMAREMSDEIGKKITDVNAGIAQNVASNRLQVAPQYAGAAQSENAARTASESQNADRFNEFSKFNAGNELDASKFNANAFMDAQKSTFGNRLGAINGQTNLYGTTPALTSLFGNQVSDAQRMNQNQQQIDNTRFGNIIRGAQT